MGDAPAWFNWLVLVVGVLYLISDFTTWNMFGIQWYSAAFTLLGLAGVAKNQ